MKTSWECRTCMEFFSSKFQPRKNQVNGFLNILFHFCFCRCLTSSSSSFFLPISSWKKQNTGYSPLTASVLPAGDTKKERRKQKSSPLPVDAPSSPVAFGARFIQAAPPTIVRFGIPNVAFTDTNIPGKSYLSGFSPLSQSQTPCPYKATWP